MMRLGSGVVSAFLLATAMAFTIPMPRTKTSSLLMMQAGKTSEFVPSMQRDPRVKTTTGSSSSSSSSPPMPGSPLSMLVLDQQEFEMSLGRALDTLRSDYPDLLTEQPDFSIYDAELETIDPSGVKLHGLKNYKNAFRLLHAIVGIFYCPESSKMQFRLCHDKARNNIRVHWNAEVIPKALFGGTHSTLHVDGISVYELSRLSGNITQHRVEHLLINDVPFRPKIGIVETLKRKADPKLGAPIFNSEKKKTMSTVVEFVQPNMGSSSSSLFAFDAGSNELEANGNSFSGMDWGAFERKNASRKKFGLKPLTPEEFQDLEAQVKQMDQRQRAAAAASSASSAAEMENKKERSGFLNKLFGTIMEDTCESNYDCERPQVCCDFGVKKMCCSSGMRVIDGPMAERQMQPIRVPVDIRDPSQF